MHTDNPVTLAVDDMTVAQLQNELAREREINRRLRTRNAHLADAMYKAIFTLGEIHNNLNNAHKATLNPTDLRASDYGR